jgi:hypothetical protein
LRREVSSASDARFALTLSFEYGWTGNFVFVESERHARPPDAVAAAGAGAAARALAAGTAPASASAARTSAAMLPRCRARVID